MRTISYEELLGLIVGFDGLPVTKLLTEDSSRIRDFVSLSLSIAWEMESWPELMRCEQRWFRADWSASTTYGAPTSTTPVEVYYPVSGKYYQSLHGTNLNNAPATGSPLAENSAHWAECETAYTADDWAAGEVYAVGDQVRNPADERYYQCITAHTAGASFDATKFGILTAFARYIEYAQTGKTAISEVIWAGNKSRRIYTTAQRYDYELTETGIQFADSLSTVWIEYSVRAPTLFGSAYSATATYAAAQQIYFSSTTTKGNYYDCLSSTSAGQSPDTHASKWSLVEIPYIFRGFIAHHAYALWLISDGQTDKAAGFKQEAFAALAREANKLWRRQNQIRRATILTR